MGSHILYIEPCTLLVHTCAPPLQDWKTNRNVKSFAVSFHMSKKQKSNFIHAEDCLHMAS